MSKIIFKPLKPVAKEKSKGRERITIQFRAYNEKGEYDKSLEGKSNQTIHLKDIPISKAYELIKSAIFNSGDFSTDFEIEE